jgi:hypothetical protein
MHVFKIQTKHVCSGFNLSIAHAFIIHYDCMHLISISMFNKVILIVTKKKSMFLVVRTHEFKTIYESSSHDLNIALSNNLMKNIFSIHFFNSY